MRSSQFAAMILPASLVLFACDTRLAGNPVAAPTERSAALSADPPGESGSLANQVCLPVSAFGSDIDQIDACLDCEEGEPCTLEQIEAGCCGPSAPVAPTVAPTETTPPAPTGDLTGALGAGAVGGVIGGGADPGPSPRPIGSPGG